MRMAQNRSGDTFKRDYVLEHIWDKFSEAVMNGSGGPEARSLADLMEVLCGGIISPEDALKILNNVPSEKFNCN